MIIHDYAVLRENSPFNHVWHFSGSSVEVGQNFIHRYFQKFSFSLTWEGAVQNRKVTSIYLPYSSSAHLSEETGTIQRQMSRVGLKCGS